MKNMVRIYFCSSYGLSKSVFALTVTEALECVVAFTCFVKSVNNPFKPQKKLLMHIYIHGNLVDTSVQYLVKHTCVLLYEFLNCQFSGSCLKINCVP